MNTNSSSRKRTLATVSAAAFGTLALTLGGAVAAQAHVGVTTDSTEAGAYTIATVSVPHACDVSPTTRVAIQIPEGINAVVPTRNAFYTVETVEETLETPLTDGHGNEVTERIAEVVYTATTPLPAGQRDAFELSLQLPEDAAGTTLFFPTVQTCEVGESAWVQIAAEGQDPHELEYPAPSINVTEGTGGGHDHGASHDAESEDVAEATGPNALAITGVALGAVGLLTAIAALLRNRK